LVHVDGKVQGSTVNPWRRPADDTGLEALGALLRQLVHHDRRDPFAVVAGVYEDAGYDGRLLQRGQTPAVFVRCDAGDSGGADGYRLLSW
jgi:hypothetical protein